MKEEFLSNCEKTFPLLAIFEDLRLDSRGLDEYRKVDICFGKEWGSCQVSFGETKVMAQVSCDIQQPKATRPNEGLLFINVELSPMGALHFDSSSQSDLSVYLNRLLEKCVKESRCVDLESLCIVADEKVWNLRVDLTVLNYDGNLIGCCSVATLASLSHFRRPDVTTSGEKIIIHSPSERDPLPISLHHHPVAVAFAIFNKGDDTRVVVDPTSLEEKASQAELVLGVNTYRELCGLHLAGSALTAPHLLMECAHKAYKHASVLVDRIKQELANDMKARSENQITGLLKCIKLDRVLGLSQDRHAFGIKSNRMFNHNSRKAEDNENEPDATMSSGDEEIQEIKSKVKGSADLKTIKKLWEPSGGESTWFVESSSESSESGKQSSEESDDDNEENRIEEDEDDNEVEVVKTVTIEDRVVDQIELSGESEEEEVLVLDASDMNEGPNRTQNSPDERKSKKS